MDWVAIKQAASCCLSTSHTYWSPALPRETSGHPTLYTLLNYMLVLYNFVHPQKLLSLNYFNNIPVASSTLLTALELLLSVFKRTILITLWIQFWLLWDSYICLRTLYYFVDALIGFCETEVFANDANLKMLGKATVGYVAGIKLCSRMLKVCWSGILAVLSSQLEARSSSNITDSISSLLGNKDETAHRQIISISLDGLCGTAQLACTLGQSSLTLSLPPKACNN